MSVVNAQFQDWKGNIYHFETSTDMIENLENEFAPLEHNHDERYYTEKEIDEMADDLKNCVVDGKNKIANAINDKSNNSQMSKDNTFDELAEGIKNIPTGGNGYDPLTYVNGLIEDLLNAQDVNFTTEYLPNNTFGFEEGHMNIGSTSVGTQGRYSYDLNNRIDLMGILAGDGNTYVQSYINSMNYTYNLDNGDRSIQNNAKNYDGGFPPTTVGSSKNAFHIKKGQYLFCLAGTKKENKKIDFLKDKFIEVSMANKGNGNLKLLYTNFPVCYRALDESFVSNTICGLASVFGGTISVYICEDDWLDIRMFFKSYYSGIYILVPTYLYRKGGSKTEFISSNK